MSVVACITCGTKNRVPVAATGTPQCATCEAKLPWLVNGGDRDFGEVTATRLPVLVDLWAPWCAPCRAVAPLLEKQSRQRAGKLKIVKVNVDDNPRTQARFNASSIPTMVLLKDGKVRARQIGALPKRELDRWLDAHLK
ncbi:MAG: thioredoxin [Arachnia sp.]